ncbi:uncharacterized protein OCT59_019209 [Rhizophagus irregularis]|uniref:Uncharacterized protein n=1 Tax=Rhizophagus irregularis (strain DAOM 181602 / DAOM 197198 / MUCL 43194) TaxID=747089 RepID=U9T462_RHIID|nr:hypothetical protein OCT59_019209 [Rhizophagus irregularis]GBC33865.1 ribonuclease H-like domain-containing protein [Rhizophagus irregularis DAOM 181602=DAOM 197198]
MFLDQIITIGSAYLHEYQKIKEYKTSTEELRDGRPKWIASWAPAITDVIYGKILTATHFPNTVPILYAEHWIHRNLDTSNYHNTPRSQTNTIIPCQGCSLHYPYYVGS